ncbi:MAG TPA: CADD family putative folate metabolism protein [Myxococcales bacterium]|nr:CADD family putative folate metabolism protein [Myxococcales bacterium]
MNLRGRMDEAIARWALLQHPFYRAWTDGTLPRTALVQYAGQYRHHVEAFPTYVSAVHARCGNDLAARQSLLENLIEEERGERNHAALWIDFAEGIGAAEVREAPAEPAVRALVETFRGLTSRQAGEGAAALYAYESQVPAVAAAKIDGLRARYGIGDARTLAFFEVHRELDVHHSAATAAIAERLSTDPDRAVEAAEAAARALWRFLDAMPLA